MPDRPAARRAEQGGADDIDMVTFTYDKLGTYQIDWQLSPIVGWNLFYDSFDADGTNSCCANPVTSGDFSSTSGEFQSRPPRSPNPQHAMLLLGFAGFGFMAYRRNSRPALMAAC